MNDGVLIPRKRKDGYINKSIYIRCTESFRARLVEAVKKSGRSASEIIREGTEEKIKKILAS